jgi:hypothetical protein
MKEMNECREASRLAALYILHFVFRNPMCANHATPVVIATC